MYYDVETLIQFAGKSSIFTYSSGNEIAVNTLVALPFGKKLIPGVVLRQNPKAPSFEAKEITNLEKTIVLGERFLDFARWFKSYYAFKSDELSPLFLPNYLLTRAKKEILGKTAPTSKIQDQPPLTKAQLSALKSIEKSKAPIILEGVVGSGKTRIYFEAAQKTLDAGKSVLILSPEIPLSEHLYKRALNFFGSNRVVNYHSEMSAAVRRSIWQKIASNQEPLVLIGPRSALFLPVKDYGLICVDEFHENAYKQLDGIHYHANDVSAALAKIHGAKIIYGSATPPIREYYFSVVKKYTNIKLNLLATGNNTKRQIEIIDQKDRKDFTKNPYLSNKVVQSIANALSHKHQVMVLHNRRGSARLVLCESCAWKFECPKCDNNLVYHQDKNKAICHTCGYSSRLPVVCPDCGSSEILLKSLGTKSLAAEVSRIFPDYKVARFDSDNSKQDSLSSRLNELEDGQIDILVGTQLLAKGLDLPKLGLVVITSADSLLQLPDFASSERLYQLIAQASGRVGRGHTDGLCIIQTYQPDHAAFIMLRGADWRGFYEAELVERRLHDYPPYTFMLKLSARRKTESGADKAASTLADSLKKTKGVVVLGPAPGLKAKENNQYIRQIIVKSRDRKKLLAIARALPAGWTADLDPTSLL